MKESKSNRRVLMLGLDAAEIGLIRRWTADGSMPELRRLCDESGLLRLDSTAAQFVGSPWPSFYLSQSPAEHGMYSFLIWRPDKLETSRPHRSWLTLRPFWRRLARNDTRVVAIDIPQAYAPLPYPGQELSGWATHETLEQPAAEPANFLDDIKNEFGVPPFDDEVNRRLNIDEALTARDQCIETALAVGELGAKLMRSEPWDLFLLCFASTHRAGHQLWDRTSLAGNPSDIELAEFDDSLRQVYIAVDKAIGKMFSVLDEQTAVLIFSLHGMGLNTSRTELTKEILGKVLENQSSSTGPAADSLTRRLRKLLPVDFRNYVKTRLPLSIQDRLTVFWRVSGIDWKNTKAFALFGDLDAYVQINLCGRESSGIVEPGKEYDELCATIAAGFKSFVDEDTGECIVDSVEMSRDTYPTGKFRDNLPDIIIHWAKTSAARHRRIVSPRFGSIEWPTPGYHPQGRSGDHERFGFLITKGFEPARELDNASIIDLAPTVYDLLGVEPPDDFEGRSIARGDE